MPHRHPLSSVTPFLAERELHLCSFPLLEVSRRLWHARATNQPDGGYRVPCRRFFYRRRVVLQLSRICLFGTRDFKSNPLVRNAGVWCKRNLPLRGHHGRGAPRVDGTGGGAIWGAVRVRTAV